MGFKSMNLEISYSSENNNMLKEFYIPVLKNAIKYDRITGYFSSSSFFVCAEGLIDFIKNNGHMRFIINVELSKSDYEQIYNGIFNPDEIIEKKLFQDFDNITDDLINNYTTLLGWLIANNVLEIKVGYVTNELLTAILHQKVGILTDVNNDIVSFSGSNNESAHGWIYNSEQIKTFFSWEYSSSKYVNIDITNFENLWNNKSSKTKVIDFPQAIKNKLIKLSEGVNISSLLDVLSSNEKELINKIENFAKSDYKINKNIITLREYQEEAINNWFDNNCNGLFEMATGTGKTYTALVAMDRLIKKNDKLVIVICCPYLHLITQWEKNIENLRLNYSQIIACSINKNWKENIQDKLLDIKLNRDKNLIILTTHDTISSDKFIDVINNIDYPLLLIGDEVHGMGSDKRMEGLLSKYQYRLGLTATPNIYFNDQATTDLINYFGGVIANFSLHRAINEIDPLTGQSYLTPYQYHIICVELTYEEFDNYIDISRQIAKLISNEKRTKRDQDYLEKKLRDRQDILKNASNKLIAFNNLLSNLINCSNIDHTLVYCSPQQITNIQLIIRDKKIISHHTFTSNENAIRKVKEYNNLTERDYILQLFSEGAYSLLVAIKCLDEGVDVPSIKTAILMCSTGNPKEYIQRRGRILRRYPGKDSATIYDIIVLPPILDNSYKDYVEKVILSELKRIEIFNQDCSNDSENYRLINNIKNKYSIN